MRAVQVLGYGSCTDGRTLCVGRVPVPEPGEGEVLVRVRAAALNGVDWKLATASIGALAAKEVFVSQLGILYSEGEADEESEGLREKLAATYTPLQGFCIMIFCLLSIPCLATLAIIKRELNSWKAPVYEAIMLFAIAYVATLVVYQVGTLLDIGTKIVG